MAVLKVRRGTPLNRGTFFSEDGVSHCPKYGDGERGIMLEARVVKIDSDIKYIRRDVDELKADVKSIDRNMVTMLAKLDCIKESLAKKPSKDTVDKRISEAKLAILLGVPALIAIGSAVYKLIAHFYFS